MRVGKFVIFDWNRRKRTR